MGATVVSGVDAPPVFETAERVFDFVALFLEQGVIGDRDFAVGFGRNAGGDVALGEGGAEPVGVVTLVGQELLGFWHGGQHQRGACLGTALTNRFATADTYLCMVSVPWRSDGNAIYNSLRR